MRTNFRIWLISALLALSAAPVWATGPINTSKTRPALSPAATAVVVVLFLAGLALILYRRFDSQQLDPPSHG